MRRKQREDEEEKKDPIRISPSANYSLTPESSSESINSNQRSDTLFIRQLEYFDSQIEGAYLKRSNFN